MNSTPQPADEPAQHASGDAERSPTSNGTDAGSDPRPSIAHRPVTRWRVIACTGAVLLVIVAAGTLRILSDRPSVGAAPAAVGQQDSTPTTVPSSAGPAWHTVAGLDTFQRLALFAAQLRDADTDAAAGKYTCRRVQQWSRATTVIHRTDTTSCRNDEDGSGIALIRTLPDRPGLLPLPDGSDRDQFTRAPMTTQQQYTAGQLRLDVPEPAPTDPAALTDAVLQHRPEVLAEAGPGFLVNRVVDLHTQQYLDRTHRAAALLVLARAQGLTFAGPANDLAGRPGMAFTLSEPDGVLTCIFNPDTGQLLAFTEVVPTGRKTKTVRPGLWGYDLLIGIRRQALLPDLQDPTALWPASQPARTPAGTAATASLDSRERGPRNWTRRRRGTRTRKAA